MQANKPWFRRKRFGIGWTPATWQGWLITVVVAVGAIAVLQLSRH